MSFIVLLSLLVGLINCSPNPAPSSTPAPRPYLDCVEDEHLPTLTDCLELIEIIRRVASKPGKNLLSRWGRSQQQAPVGRTRKLPKKFYGGIFPRPTPNSCMFLLDDNPLEGKPDYDDFRLSNVTDTGERLVIRCLAVENQGGYDYPGPRGTVYERLMRSVPYANTANTSAFSSVPEMANVTVVGTEMVGNETWTLYEETSFETDATSNVETSEPPHDILTSSAGNHSLDWTS